MAAPEKSYWSIEACAWVRFPPVEAEVPAQRAEEEGDVLGTTDLPSDVPV